MAVGQDTSIITCQLFFIKAKTLKVCETTILKKIGVFAFRNLPITKHRWDRNVNLTKLFTWISIIRSALALCESSASGFHEICKIPDNIEKCLRFQLAVHSTLLCKLFQLIYKFLSWWRGCLLQPRGVLPRKRLLGICHYMGSHFHNWVDYNGVTPLVELLEWGHTFLGFLG